MEKTPNQHGHQRKSESRDTMREEPARVQARSSFVDGTLDFHTGSNFTHGERPARPAVAS